MKKMKRFVAFLIIMAMVAALAGCGSAKSDKNKVKSENGGKPVEISYWNSGMGTEFLDAVIKLFNEKQSDWYVYYTATADSVAARTAFGLSDVDTVDLYMTSKVSETENMTDLDDVLDSVPNGESKKIKEKIYSSQLEYDISADGHYYTLPWGGGTIAVIYNEALFEQANIKTLPRTTDELAVACDKLYEEGITPLTHYRAEEGIGYWTYIQEQWFAQYDGWDYYKNNFYGCKDAEGNSPSEKVFTTKDGRYQVLKAMEKIITPEYIQSGANSQDHISAQTMFLTQNIGMMVSGSWMANEMRGTKSAEGFGVMKTPVVSGIVDKLTSVKSDTELRNLISAIDEVTEGKTDVSTYQSGDGYLVNGKQVTSADWDYVAAARNSVAVNYPQHTCFIPKYSDAIDGAKEFLKFFYSDEAYKVYTEKTHCVLPMDLCTGEINTEGWSKFEKDMANMLETADSCINRHFSTRHEIFPSGGATPYAYYNFGEYFCSNNPSDRVTADEAWEQIVKIFEANYKNWYANIQ